MLRDFQSMGQGILAGFPGQGECHGAPTLCASRSSRLLDRLSFIRLTTSEYVL
jgi:hypothetical protein